MMFVALKALLVSLKDLLSIVLGKVVFELVDAVNIQTDYLVQKLENLVALAL